MHLYYQYWQNEQETAGKKKSGNPLKLLNHSYPLAYNEMIIIIVYNRPHDSEFKNTKF